MNVVNLVEDYFGKERNRGINNPNAAFDKETALCLICLYRVHAKDFQRIKNWIVRNGRGLFNDMLVSLDKKRKERVAMLKKKDSSMIKRVPW